MAAAGDHLVDAGGGQRLPVVHAQPQLQPPGLPVPGAGADIPVQAPGRLVADPDDPGLPPLPRTVISRCHRSMSLRRRSPGSYRRAGQLGQPDAGGPGAPAMVAVSRRCAKAPARTGMF